MPTYVYECRSCQTTFEVEQRITADSLTDCDCGATGSLKRLIQPIAVMFKGGGFHINDYASAKSAEVASESVPEPAPACTGEPTACPACQPSETATS
mgnify:CR=1 FL=1